MGKNGAESYGIVGSLDLGAKMIGRYGRMRCRVTTSSAFIRRPMMKNLLLGDFLRVKNVTLPKGIYVKLQTYTSDFLNTSDPKAISGF
ncbi:ubiquitin fusion degradation protein 1 [Artemisia annua]|uniref:Ubiquitin fusion degradation protein 1 n=1 Tax=Artemisia annua TaxID=35608 RepID=A0A2U1Q9E8_ARTAN|nr:ubiquitin fusion degradation protein 1 [Artemisia annua]